MSWWSELCGRIGDFVFIWLLYLPRDLTLVLLAASSALILLLIRRFAANQIVLRSARQDDRRLKRLIKRWRRRGDRQRVQQYRRTRGEVARVRMKSEAWPALLALLPLMVIVTWASARLAFYPPRCDSATELVLQTPITGVGQVVHLVPNSNLRSSAGWLREIKLDMRKSPKKGIAWWHITIRPPAQDTSLQIRYGATTLEHPFRAGQVTYAPPVKVHAGDIVTKVSLQRYRPFAFVPNTRWLPAWTIGYLLFTAFFFFVGKRLVRID